MGDDGEDGTPTTRGDKEGGGNTGSGEIPETNNASTAESSIASNTLDQEKSDAVVADANGGYGDEKGEKSGDDKGGPDEKKTKKQKHKHKTHHKTKKEKAKHKKHHGSKEKTGSNDDPGSDTKDKHHKHHKSHKHTKTKNSKSHHHKKQTHKHKHKHTKTGNKDHSDSEKGNDATENMEGVTLEEGAKEAALGKKDSTEDAGAGKEGASDGEYQPQEKTHKKKKEGQSKGRGRRRKGQRKTEGDQGDVGPQDQVETNKRKRRRVSTNESGKASAKLVRDCPVVLPRPRPMPYSLDKLLNTIEQKQLHKQISLYTSLGRAPPTNKSDEEKDAPTITLEELELLDLPDSPVPSPRPVLSELTERCPGKLPSSPTTNTANENQANPSPQNSKENENPQVISSPRTLTPPLSPQVPTVSEPKSPELTSTTLPHDKSPSLPPSPIFNSEENSQILILPSLGKQESDKQLQNPSVDLRLHESLQTESQPQGETRPLPVPDSQKGESPSQSKQLPQPQATGAPLVDVVEIESDSPDSHTSPQQSLPEKKVKSKKHKKQTVPKPLKRLRRGTSQLGQEEKMDDIIDITDVLNSDNEDESVPKQTVQELIDVEAELSSEGKSDVSSDEADDETRQLTSKELEEVFGVVGDSTNAQQLKADSKVAQDLFRSQAANEDDAALDMVMSRFADRRWAKRLMGEGNTMSLSELLRSERAGLINAQQQDSLSAEPQSIQDELAELTRSSNPRSTLQMRQHARQQIEASQESQDFLESPEMRQLSRMMQARGSSEESQQEENPPPSTSAPAPLSRRSSSLRGILSKLKQSTPSALTELTAAKADGASLVVFQQPSTPLHPAAGTTPAPPAPAPTSSPTHTSPSTANQVPSHPSTSPPTSATSATPMRVPPTTIASLARRRSTLGQILGTPKKT
ncbi:hypothetical protein Pelo_13763 [Pelomyxa schiedti]|nr:hypothetical protein Pelo_13763 [Pelomyxa schiedti]